MAHRTGPRPYRNAPRHTPARAPRRRRWLRWTAIAVAAVACLVVAGTWAFMKFQPTSAPLALPAGAASSPADHGTAEFLLALRTGR